MSQNRVLAAVGAPGRIVTARLLPGSDFMSGLAQVCRESGIRNGSIVSCIGSLKRAVFLDPVAKPETRAGYGYGAPITVEGPIELLSAAGLICHSDTGDVLTHVHATMCLSDGKAFGGHLVDPGNEVLLTADIVIVEISGIDMVRRHDPETEILMFSPTSWGQPLGQATS